MTRPKFSIGVDLGTSNSVLAYSSLSGDRPSKVLVIPQWDTPATVVEAVTVPSFLYLPEEEIAELMQARDFGAGAWAVGRLAKRKASETPGRVVQSAKSWLCHHAADRTAPFLPWLSETVAEQDKISPVAASALILAHLRAAWNDRFAEQGSGLRVRRAKHHHHRAGVLRRRGATADPPRRAASRLSGSRAPAGRAAGGVLCVAGTEG